MSFALIRSVDLHGMVDNWKHTKVGAIGRLNDNLVVREDKINLPLTAHI